MLLVLRAMAMQLLVPFVLLKGRYWIAEVEDIFAFAGTGEAWSSSYGLGVVGIRCIFGALATDSHGTRRRGDLNCGSTVASTAWRVEF